MKLINGVHFLLGAADEKLDLGVLLHKVDDTNYRVYGVAWQGAPPDVDSVTVHRGGVFYIAVIEVVFYIGKARVSAAPRAVNDYFARADECIDCIPKIVVVVHFFTFPFLSGVYDLFLKSSFGKDLVH